MGLVGTFDTSGFGTLFDVQYDSGCRRIATASADKVVRVWAADTREVQRELHGHKAEVLSVAWAGGQNAAVLASAAADGKVIVWREVKFGEWTLLHQCSVRGSATVAAFCPAGYGLMLAVASGTSGEVTVFSVRDVKASPVLPAGQQWTAKVLQAHEGGAVALSWGPSTSPATMVTGPAVARAATFAPRRFATGGKDGLVKIWHYDDKADAWAKHHEMSDASVQGALRDVAWRPNVGIPSSSVASCTDGGWVAVWVQDMEGQTWRLEASWQVSKDARRLSWSPAGRVLAVSAGDDEVLMYRELSVGEWGRVANLGDED